MEKLIDTAHPHHTLQKFREEILSKHKKETKHHSVKRKRQSRLRRSDLNEKAFYCLLDEYTKLKNENRRLKRLKSPKPTTTASPPPPSSEHQPPPPLSELPSDRIIKHYTIPTGCHDPEDYFDVLEKHKAENFVKDGIYNALHATDPTNFETIRTSVHLAQDVERFVHKFDFPPTHDEIDESTKAELDKIHRLAQRKRYLQRKLRKIPINNLEWDERDKNDLQTIVEQGHTRFTIQ